MLALTSPEGHRLDEWASNTAVIAATLAALRADTGPGAHQDLELPAPVTEVASPTAEPQSPANPPAAAEHKAPETEAPTPEAEAASAPSPEPEPAPATAPATARPAPEPAPATRVEVSFVTRRALREQATAQDRRRSGLFGRILTVRTFRANHGRDRLRVATIAAVGSLLDEATVHGVLSLHSRHVPGQRGVVDHLAVGPGGVYVVSVFPGTKVRVELATPNDAAGQVDLVVGGQVTTSAADATARRVTAVRALLDEQALGAVPVTAVLCVVDGLFPIGVSELEVHGVRVLPQGRLTSLAATDGWLDEDHRSALHDYLGDRLPAAEPSAGPSARPSARPSAQPPAAA